MRNHGGNAAKLLRARAKGDDTWDAKIAELVAGGTRKGPATPEPAKTESERLMAPILEAASVGASSSAPPRHVRSSLSCASASPPVASAKPVAVDDDSGISEDSTVVQHSLPPLRFAPPPLRNGPISSYRVQVKNLFARGERFGHPTLDEVSFRAQGSCVGGVAAAAATASHHNRGRDTLTPRSSPTHLTPQPGC